MAQAFRYNLWQEAACPLPRNVMLLKVSALQPQNYHFQKQWSAIYQNSPRISFQSHHGLLKLKFLIAFVFKKTFLIHVEYMIIIVFTSNLFSDHVSIVITFQQLISPSQPAGSLPSDQVIPKWF